MLHGVERIHLWGPDTWEAYEARLMQTDLLSGDDRPVITEIHTDRTVDAEDLEFPQVAQPEPEQESPEAQPAAAKPLQPAPVQPQAKPRSLKPRSLKPRTRSQPEAPKAQPEQGSQPKSLAELGRMMRDD